MTSLRSSGGISRSAARASGVMALLSMALLAGCAAKPANLDQAATAIQSARADPQITQYAPAELDKAQTELDSANNAWETGKGRDDATNGATIAMQQVEIARAMAEQRKAQAQVSQLGDTREKVLRQSAEQEVATLRQQLASLQAKQTDRGIVLTMGDVLFDVDQATLKPGAVEQMSRLAQFLQQHPDQSLRIEGYTELDRHRRAQSEPVAAPRRRRAQRPHRRRRPPPAHRRRRPRRGLPRRHQRHRRGSPAEPPRQHRHRQPTGGVGLIERGLRGAAPLLAAIRALAFRRPLGTAIPAKEVRGRGQAGPRTRQPFVGFAGNQS